MEIRFLSRRLALLTILVCSLTFLALTAAFDRAEAETLLADRAAEYLKNEYADYGLINADMGVGSYVFYILTAAGVDVSAWKYDGTSLADAVTRAIRSDIADAGQVSAKRLAHDLAAAKALGRENEADQLIQLLKSRQSSEGFDQIGPLSVYSNIPAFEMLGRLGLLDQFDAGLTRGYVLGMRYAGSEDKYRGSWGSLDDGKFYADFMAVTGAVRLLSRIDPGGSDAALQEAVNSGLEWLKRQQQPDGNFMAGMDDTLIDTCDVIITLGELGIDPAAWVSGAGKSPVDYLESEALNPDGSFGQSGNVLDAVLVLWACRALEEKTAGTAGQEQPAQAQPSQEAQPAPDSPAAPPVQTVRSFTDTAGHWAQESISRMAARGITAGYADGSFRPEALVTRNEIAAMLARLLGPEPAATQDVQMISDSFADAGDIPGWALNDVAVALREGLVSGYPQPDGSLCFAGDRTVNRAELSALLARVMEIKPGQTEPRVLDFADNNLIPDWAGRYIGIVYAGGIAGGYPDRTFRAEKPVTRAEAASMIMRLAERTEDK